MIIAGRSINGHMKTVDLLITYKSSQQIIGRNAVIKEDCMLSAFADGRTVYKVGKRYSILPQTH